MLRHSFMLCQYITVLLECDQILGTGLAVVEDNEHAGIVLIVHDTVVLLNGHVALGRRRNHVLLPLSEIPSQHLAEVHELLPISIRLGVCVAGRVVGIDSKVCAVAMDSS